MTAARAQTAGDSGGTEGVGEGVGGDEVPLVFRQAVAALGGVRHRAEVSFGALPAPKRLAPYAHALEVTVEDAGEEVADGRFVLLHDPREPESWQGAFRVVTLARAELEPEMAADPLLPEVTWSWLTGALEARELGYGEPSGTVTRSGSHFFGGLAERPAQSELEIRASWTPPPSAAPDGGEPVAAPDVAAHLAAWCDMLCQCAGLPPGGTGGDGAAEGPDRAAVLPLPQRRGPQRR
ncbi:DUF3000 domain-containing protein [Streptomyces sp. N2-109]|uniref:DUF3000 domain-containing protein n=1 Tax=Streptomyces gossypii TaxID=2883101 RepID=A0ABT2JTZ4_9ACTN|nr:DUF3000 domain-containing protein [Streptomyces gossypii]MCT2590845.1 DUF3000 domain-containing protein [Streptomyces gossypii]